MSDFKLPGLFHFPARCSNCGEKVTVSVGYQRSTYEPEFILYKLTDGITRYKLVDSVSRFFLEKEPEIHTCCGKGKDCDCLK